MRLTQAFAYVHGKEEPDKRLLTHLTPDIYLKRLREKARKARRKYAMLRKKGKRLVKLLDKGQNWITKRDIIV